MKVALAGIGNCASSLVQGVHYYKDVKSNDEPVPGLMHNVLGGYKISDIEFVAAFDIDKRKIGKDLSQAIFSKPNCTTVFCGDVPKQDVKVQKGPVLDGFPDHMLEYPEQVRFSTDNAKPVDVTQALKDSGAEMLLNYMPVGSQEATEYYAQACLDAGVAFINCMPVFIASDPEGVWPKKFEKAKLPIVGDDVKSQVGATIVHRVLSKLFNDRGVKLDRTYQLNVGGNTDFMNLIEHSRGKTKKISKTEAVQSQLAMPLKAEDIHIGPSDYVPWLKDNKLCFLRMEGKKFGNVPLEVELRLSVEDSPNSGGSMIDAIRCCKLALDRKITGPLLSISAYTMKHPPQQFPDFVARQMVEEYIRGERER
jgi:myo-inositol-1-phosphate synthase